MSDPKPRISVLIPSRNHAALLVQTVASIRAQQFPPDAFEIVIVDDGCTDETQERVAPFLDGKLPLVRYVRQQPRGLNAARNHGLREARADFFVLTDDDVEVPPHWLATYEKAARQFPEAGAFGGPVHPRLEGNSPLPKTCGRCGTLEQLETFDRGATDTEVPWVIGANFAFPRTTLQTIGTFNETIPCWQGDETEWLLRLRRAGLGIVYVAAAGLVHRRPADVVAPMILRRKYYKAKGGVWYARETGGKLPSPFKALRQMLRWKLHQWRAQCFLGSVRATVNRGLLVGWLQWIVLRRRAPRL
jgi:glycosyltransferase involved in cell wall biosynthesis